MLKNTLKKLAIFLIFSIVLNLIPIPVFAAPSDLKVERLAGYTQYDTAAEIAKKGWTTSTYAVIAYGQNYPDALAAAPLAKKYDAPILLTEKARLTAVTKETLAKLKVSKVFIVGGTAVVSQATENQIKAMGIAVERLAGWDMYETAVKVAEKLGTSNELFVATGSGFEDALCVAPIASQQGSPILLVPKNEMPNSVAKYLSTRRFDKIYVIGDTNVISAELFRKFSYFSNDIERVKSGSVNIAKKFNSRLDRTKTCLATNAGYADSLSGSAYAAKYNHPILLVNKDPNKNGDLNNYLQNKSIYSLIVFGGEAVVPTSVIDHIINYYEKNCMLSLANSPDLGYSNIELYTELYLNGERITFKNHPYFILAYYYFPFEELYTILSEDFLAFGDGLIEAIRAGEQEYIYTDSFGRQVKMPLNVLDINNMLYIDDITFFHALNSKYNVTFSDYSLCLIEKDAIPYLDMVKVLRNSYSPVPLSIYREPLTTNSEIKAKTEELIRGLTSDYDKFVAISNWVSDNIYYDYDSYYGKRSLPLTSTTSEGAFETRVAVCEGYAHLTCDMLRLAGIPARIFASDTHTWLDVYLDGEWVESDPTWNSGNRYENGTYIKSESNTNYLTSVPRDHFHSPIQFIN